MSSWVHFIDIDVLMAVVHFIHTGLGGSTGTWDWSTVTVSVLALEQNSFIVDENPVLPSLENKNKQM